MEMSDTVAVFMRVTGATEFHAIQALQQFGGDVDKAIDAYFLGEDRFIVCMILVTRLSGRRQNHAAVRQYNNSAGIVTFVNAARRLQPSLLLHPNYREEHGYLYNMNGATSTIHPSPLVCHPVQVREVPARINSALEPHYQSGLSTTGADTTANLSSYGLGIHGTNEYPLAQSKASHVSDDEIEEAMLQTAIEASIMERREGFLREQFVVVKGSFDDGLRQQEDADLARAISLSLEDDYPVSPRAEKQKELNSLNKAESHSSKEEESCKKMLENKDADFPVSPQADKQKELNSLNIAESHSSKEEESCKKVLENKDADCPVSPRADRKRELNSLNKAESHSSKEEESCKKMLDNKFQQVPSQCCSISSPVVPSSGYPATAVILGGWPMTSMRCKEPDLYGVITIVVQMPDGSRLERHFDKTDKVQLKGMELSSLQHKEFSDKADNTAPKQRSNKTKEKPE
ncbi:Plant UBX domain-containing protein 9, partial [Mucuna pruriens]